MIVKHLNWRKLIRPLSFSISFEGHFSLPFLLFFLLFLAFSLPVCKPSIPFLPNIQVLAFLRQAIITIIINIIVEMVERSKELLCFGQSNKRLSRPSSRNKRQKILLLSSFFSCFKTAAVVPPSFFILFSLSIIESTFNVIKLIYLKCRKKGKKEMPSLWKKLNFVYQKRKQASHIHVSREHSSHFNLKPWLLVVSRSLEPLRERQSEKTKHEALRRNQKIWRF